MLNLIHYGAAAFDPLRFIQAKSPCFYDNKPDPATGFWCCPADASPSWKDFVAQSQLNRFNTETFFSLSLAREARVLTVNRTSDLRKLVWHGRWGTCGINWEDARDRYDAIYLTAEGLEDTGSVSDLFNLVGWSCECVLVLNQVIEPSAHPTT